MSHVAWVWTNPYEGLAASVVTSNAIDLRDALAWSYSWYTTAGTVSAHTFQVSNSSAESPADVPNASYVARDAFGTGTPALITGDPGIRWGRIIKVVSGSSVVVDFNKQVG